MSRTEITACLEQIFKGIARLKATFPHRAFTIDGRLVGDVGEVIGALEYDVELDLVSRKTHDAKTSDGRDVQIKATFKDQLTIRSIPDFYLGFKLFPNGEFEEIYNGPGRPIAEKYAHRKGIGTALLSFPLSELRKLSAKVPPDKRVARREGPEEAATGVVIETPVQLSRVLDDQLPNPRRDREGVIINAHELTAAQVAHKKVRCPACEKLTFKMWPEGRSGPGFLNR